MVSLTKDWPALPTLPAEHFRCLPRRETLLRSACAAHYARVAVAGSTAPGDQHCSGCRIGATHGTGHVPTHAAPAVPALDPFEGQPIELPKRRGDPGDGLRDARCERCRKAFKCSGRGRIPKLCARCRGTKP